MTKTPDASKIKLSEGNELLMIQDNSLVAVSSPIVFKGVSLGLIEDFGQGVVSNKVWTTEELKSVISQLNENKALIECLIKYESNWNINAVGDNGLAFSVLQFHKTTFELYKNKYSMEWLEYENPVHQIILADIMINNHLENQWTTIKYCR